MLLKTTILVFAKLIKPILANGVLSIVINSYIFSVMTIQSNESNLKIDADVERPNSEKSKSARPNIDHLIKRILSERREQEKKNIFTITFILLIIGATTLFSIYN